MDRVASGTNNEVRNPVTIQIANARQGGPEAINIRERGSAIQLVGDLR